MNHSSSAAPVAAISVSALRRNITALAGGSAFAVDLRHDAWGHGAELVGRVAADLGGAAGLDADSGAVPVLPADGMYGLRPGSAPVMRLSGTVLTTKVLRTGEGVSYGYAYRAPQDTRVALVTGGYAQGIVRALGGRIRVLLGGVMRPVVGRVAMDVCIVELGRNTVSRGDEAVFFGDPAHGAPSLAEWTAPSGMTAAELAVAVGLLVDRVEVP